MSKEMKFEKSILSTRYLQDSCPVGSQTFSKAARYYSVGASPLVMDHGQAGHCWDVDGNEFVDYVLGLGPITLGYRFPAVDDAIKRQLKKGITFSQPTNLEWMMATKIKCCIPCAETIRFSKTGSEVCQAAIKIARAYTGRLHVAYWGYHGWHSWYSAISDRPEGGIPEEKGYMHQFKYNDLLSLEEILHRYKVAAVIMEPMVAQLPKENYLSDVIKLAHQNGAVVIFDEMVTGFRWAIGGAQEVFSAMPDLTTFGKGVANGMPLSGVCGKRDVMQVCERIFFSTTFGGECLSLEAGLATIDSMKRYDYINHIYDYGQRLCGAIGDIGKDFPYSSEDGSVQVFSTMGMHCRPKIIVPFEDDAELGPYVKTYFMEQMIQKGILLHSGMLVNLCLTHSERDLEKTINAFEDVVPLVVDALSKNDIRSRIKGRLIQPAFKRL